MMRANVKPPAILAGALVALAAMSVPMTATAEGVTPEAAAQKVKTSAAGTAYARFASACPSGVCPDDKKKVKAEAALAGLRSACAAAMGGDAQADACLQAVIGGPAPVFTVTAPPEAAQQEAPEPPAAAPVAAKTVKGPEPPPAPAPPVAVVAEVAPAPAAVPVTASCPEAPDCVCEPADLSALTGIETRLAELAQRPVVTTGELDALNAAAKTSAQAEIALRHDVAAVTIEIVEGWIATRNALTRLRDASAVQAVRVFNPDMLDAVPSADDQSMILGALDGPRLAAEAELTVLLTRIQTVHKDVKSLDELDAMASRFRATLEQPAPNAAASPIVTAASAVITKLRQGPPAPEPEVVFSMGSLVMTREDTKIAAVATVPVLLLLVVWLLAQSFRLLWRRRNRGHH